MKVEGDDVALAQKGDTGAFERLYRASVSRIHSLARRMAGEEAADDLTQEVFIRAWEKIPTFRGESAFDTWLHRLAVNLILTRGQSLRKRESRQVGGPELLESLPGRSGIPGFGVDFERALEVSARREDEPEERSRRGARRGDRTFGRCDHMRDISLLGWSAEHL